MTDNLKTTFDKIRAEDRLKESTMRYLRDEIRKRDSARKRKPVRRFAVALASAAVIFFAGAFSHNIYFSPSAYIDLDVNPSIELAINRFDKVIDAYAYNAEGESVLYGLSIKHKNYENALLDLMEALNQEGYITDDGLVSVTLQTDDKIREQKLLSGIQEDVTGYMYGHHGQARVDVFPVSGDTRGSAHELGLSPAKYIAIQELMEADPAVTVESCRGHSISEIKQLTRGHMGGHDNDPANDTVSDPAGGNQGGHQGQGGRQGHGGHHGGVHE